MEPRLSNLFHKIALVLGDYPFERTRFSEKVEKWDDAYFQEKLDATPILKDINPDSFMVIVKGLLNIDPQKRLSIEKALAQLAHATPFPSLDAQQVAFIELKQQEPSSGQPHAPFVSREQDENYEHVFAKRYGYKFTPDFAPPPSATDASADYSNPIPFPEDTSSYNNPIPRSGDSSGYTNPSPPSYEYV